MSENNYTSKEEEFKQEMERARQTGEPYFTATQKQILNKCQEFSAQELIITSNKIRSADTIISINRTGKFKIFWNSIIRFFKKIFGFKINDDHYRIYVDKNRCDTGVTNFTINHKQ